jgi:hypothetical protein
MPTYGCTRTGMQALLLSTQYRPSRRRAFGALSITDLHSAVRHVTEAVAAAFASDSVHRCLY